MRLKKTFFFKICLFAALSFVFLFVYSTTTSPMLKYYGADSAFFMTVGKGMTEGLMPYRDFFDMKGPYLFFIEYIGQLLSYGRLGIFLVQCINLFLCLWIIDRICKVPFTGFWRWIGQELLCILPVLYIASFTFEGGNLTEEFALPLLLLALYFTLTYFEKGHARHPLWIGLYYGAAFGILALTRITNAAFIGAAIFTISIELIAAKEYKNLLMNGVAFILGCLGAFVPVCIVFHAAGLLEEMLQQVFVFGVLYSSEVSLADKLYYVISRYWTTLLPMALPLIVLAAFRVRERRYWVLSTAAFVLLFIAVTMGNAYLHYFTLGIPNVVMGIALIIKFRHNQRLPVRGLLAVAIAGILLLQIPNFTTYSKYSAIRLLGFGNDSTRYQAALEVKELIPAEDYDRVFAFALPSCSNWYAMTDLRPAYRYCDWHTHYINLMPQIEDEIALWLRSEDSKWVVTTRNYTFIHKKIQAVITSDYQVFAETDSYTLYVKQP